MLEHSGLKCQLYWLIVLWHYVRKVVSLSQVFTHLENWANVEHNFMRLVFIKTVMYFKVTNVEKLNKYYFSLFPLLWSHQFTESRKGKL